jgi:hypothetical protein
MMGWVKVSKVLAAKAISTISISASVSLNCILLSMKIWLV